MDLQKINNIYFRKPMKDVVRSISTIFSLRNKWKSILKDPKLNERLSRGKYL